MPERRDAPTWRTTTATADESERSAALVCDDGIDDDGDGLADFSADPGCDSASDESEKSWALACDDGHDNDGDALTDYPADTDCGSLNDVLEAHDEDSDGVADAADNCVTVQNPSQFDSNQDGYGNACDADYNDDGERAQRPVAERRLPGIGRGRAADRSPGVGGAHAGPLQTAGASRWRIPIPSMRSAPL